MVVFMFLYEDSGGDGDGNDGLPQRSKVIRELMNQQRHHEKSLILRASFRIPPASNFGSKKHHMELAVLRARNTQHLQHTPVCALENDLLCRHSPPRQAWDPKSHQSFDNVTAA